MTNAPTQSNPQAPKFLESRREKAAMWIFVLSNMFCATEMVPGWGIFHLGWPHETFYLIAAAGGLISGALFGRRYFIAGMIGGAVASVGALVAVAMYLDDVKTSHSAIMAVLAMVGALPGLGVGLT